MRARGLSMKSLTLLALALMLSGCCASENPWHTAPWRYGYEPNGEAELLERRPITPWEQEV